MTEKKPKKVARPSVKNTPISALERDLARTKKALSNKKLLPQSVRFYSRRKEAIEAEIDRRK